MSAVHDHGSSAETDPRAPGRLFHRTPEADEAAVKAKADTESDIPKGVAEGGEPPEVVSAGRSGQADVR